MRLTEDILTVQETSWVESSGLLHFLASVGSEVERFNENFGFGLRYIQSPPEAIDADAEIVKKLAFTVIRFNRLMPERQYCLYALLKDRSLCGYIGIYRDAEITTIRELSSVSDFQNSKYVLYDWLRSLIKASCEKY